MDSYCLAGNHTAPTQQMQWFNGHYACTKCIAQARFEAAHAGASTAYAMCQCRQCRHLRNQRIRDLWNQRTRKRTDPTP
jgi:hypothetical protein